MTRVEVEGGRQVLRGWGKGAFGKRFLILVLAACSHRAPPDASKFDAITLDSPPGVSDLTEDDHGGLWAIPERDRFILQVAQTGEVVRYPLDGVPSGLDTESLTWLGPGHFAIGTEDGSAPTASVLWAEQRGNRFAITRERPLTAAEVGLQMTANHGAEGICGTAADLYIAIESRDTLPDGTKWAPIVHLHGDQVSVAKLRLTTKTGKISALHCHGAEAWAIERHYEVSRILHFTIPEAAGEITPEVVVDLDAIFHGNFNFEGIVRLPGNRMVLVNDNQGSHVEGPTKLFFLR